MHIFVYGTLQNDEIIRAITGKTFQKVPYSLSGYEVRRVDNEHFPGMIVSDKNSAANGFILKDIDEASYRAILNWEDKRYKVIRLSVSLNGKEAEADTFVWTQPEALGGDWSNVEYRKGHMNKCISECIPKMTTK